MSEEYNRLKNCWFGDYWKPAIYLLYLLETYGVHTSTEAMDEYRKTKWGPKRQS